MRIKRPKVILALFFILYSLFFISPVFAQENIGSSKLSPDNPFYFLKAVRESLEIKFAGTEKVRVLRRLEFAQRRLREVNSLITVHREDLVQPNIEKFLLELTLFGLIKDQSLHEVISDSLGYYMQVLVTLYGDLTDPKARLGVRSAIYRLALTAQIYPPQVSKFTLGCDLLTKEASSSALNESERQVLKERGRKCERLLTLQ